MLDNFSDFIAEYITEPWSPGPWSSYVSQFCYMLWGEAFIQEHGCVV